jgi:hypothetical protein
MNPNPNNQRISRRTFLDLSVLSFTAVASGYGLRNWTPRGFGYTLHSKYGSELGMSELRKKVCEFKKERAIMPEEWHKETGLLLEKLRRGDDAVKPRLDDLYSEYDRIFGFAARHEKYFKGDSRYTLAEKRKPSEICFEYTFDVLRKENAGYPCPHNPEFSPAMRDMSYIPVNQPRSSDVIMYYNVERIAAKVNPVHWGMTHNGQVISKNFGELFAIHHDIDAVHAGRFGPTHCMFFRKIPIS